MTKRKVSVSIDVEPPAQLEAAGSVPSDHLGEVIGAEQAHREQVTSSSGTVDERLVQKYLDLLA